MSDLLQEVDEIMRQERMKKLWDENKNYIITFVVGTILLTALVSGYRSWNTSQQHKQTAELSTLQTAENYPENILSADKLKLRGGLRGIAYLNAGNAFLAEDKTDEALQIFQKASADKGIPTDLRSLAVLMNVRLASNTEGADTKELLSLLTPIAGSSGNAYAPQAHLEMALLQAHKLGDYEKAQAHLTEILETPNVPETLYNRARDLSGLYRLKQSQKDAEND